MSDKLTNPKGKVIPFSPLRWSFIGAVEVVEYLGQQAVELGTLKKGDFNGYGAVVLKDTEFRNGIIEFDINFNKKQMYTGVHFRLTEENQNCESFYMRPHVSGTPDANSYIPVYHDIQSWQLYYGDGFSSNAEYSYSQWNHVKIIVNDDIANIYINNMEVPENTVALKHDNNSGSIELYTLNFGGVTRFANFAIVQIDGQDIKEIPTEEKAAQAGTVLNWEVSDAFEENELSGKTSIKGEFAALNYTRLKSDFTGITNLAKVQGIKDGKDTVFAKIVVQSDCSQIKKMNLGFANKVKVYLNGNILFEGDDNFQSRDETFLGTMGFYDSVYLHLEKGKNEILLAVTENSIFKGGWGAQARFEDMRSISFIGL